MTSGETLLAIQEADLEIRRATKQLDELPVKGEIIATRKKAREVEALRAKAEELVARLDRAMARNEDETATLCAKIESEQQKVMSGDITNPKEVQHITREMDSLRRRTEKLEMEDLALMERAEKARGQIAKIDAALQTLAAKEKDLTVQFQAQGGELQGALAVSTARREKLAGALDSELLARYEKVREAKHGIGAAHLMGIVCSACRMELPAERVDELKNGPEIGKCPACQRLLVILPPEPDTDQ